MSTICCYTVPFALPPRPEFLFPDPFRREFFHVVCHAGKNGLAKDFGVVFVGTGRGGPRPKFAN